MKLAIIGNTYKDSEVISILESFGAKNKNNLRGNRCDYLYTFDDVGDSRKIITVNLSQKNNYCYFTVDEFYKLCPFKVGDNVTYFENQHTIERLFWNTINESLRVVLNGEVYALPEDIKWKDIQVGLRESTLDPFQVGNDVYWNGKLCCIVSINEDGLGKGCDPIYRVRPYDGPFEETYGAFRENLLPPDLDSECVELVTCLNNVAEVVTFGSCCGHLESNYFVLFRCNDHEKLARLSRSVNRNYSDGKWLIELTDTDGAPCYNYMLRSKEPFVTLDEMRESINKLIDNIHHWYSSDFDSYFKTNGNEGNSVINLNHYKNSEIELILGDKEIIERDGKTYAIIKKPRYPKTYKECCDVLGTLDNDAQGYEADLIISFQELLIARDAYWKIAGEEMGLDKPWEPDWKNKENTKYCITTINRQIKTITTDVFNYFLAFPTEEMRDAFYENFKDLIERCKELL